MVVSANGYVVVKSGGATASSPDPNAVSPARADSVVCPGQQLEVGRNSRAAIYLSNNSFVRLSENTVMSFPATQNEGSFWVELKQGVSHFISRITLRFGVKTAYTNAVVDGTEFLVSAHSDRTQVSVVEGSVSVTIGQQGIQVPVAAGEGVVVDGSPQFKRIQLSATESVDWAVYFPPLVVVDELTTSQHSTALQQAKQHLSQSRPDLAIQTLEAITEPDSAIAVALAASYLSVGHVARAEQAISQVQSAQAQALRSLMAVLTNQPQQAVAIAAGSEARTLSQHLARSYAYQANLEMPRALQAAREASAQYPDQSAAWVRLSELQVAMGDVGAAADSIAKARQLTPQDPAVLVQSAYVDLFNNRFQEAEAQFRQAIARHSEDPQARLGLGLVLLRQGDLEAGRKQLEFAVSLDPARSVLRSYLGRAYFEEKRDDEASVQWALAKQLDPEDPTAYFYEGVRKLYSNDPIAAIEELEKSRQLNDERALYRSETLLQSDEASRSAVLARAYDEVGYDHEVLREGRRSLKKDPTNSDGHRLLADDYRDNSRYESARGSETLQSQLLQPLTAFPLQPQLSETGISYVEGTGPQKPGYNEFHSLFTRDGPYGAVNGFVGSDGTWADDLVGSFIAGPLAISLGQYHFESDGWRDNTSQEQDIYDAFVQWQATDKLSMQAEYRSLSWDFGDLTPELQSTSGENEGERLDRKTSRFGLNYQFSTKDVILLSLSNRELDDNTDSSLSFLSREERNESELDSVELQYIKVLHRHKLIVGASYFELEDSIDIWDSASAPAMPGVTAVFDRQNDTSTSPEVVNVYAYYSYVFSNFEIDFGLTYAELGREINAQVDQSFLFVDANGSVVGSIPQPSGSDSMNSDVEKLSPKIGLSWVSNPIEFKFAAYRGFRYLPKLDQSIEPTLFSGFYQLFDDPLASTSETIAAELNYSSADNWVSGISVLRRFVDYDEIYLSPAIALEHENIEFDENLANLYFVITPVQALSLSAQLDWERRDYEDFGFAVSRVDFIDLYSVPIAINLFNAQKTSFKIEQVYYKQRYKENDFTSMTEDNTWVTNMSIRRTFEGLRGDVSFGVRNLLDEKTEFVNFDASTLQFYPSRFWYAAVNINL
ncbi:FecR domain-containing protein [Ketobacter sp.]|uniref:FecR domain-containing protein n=1 Tax=Ketobacter sp. TaxID=2083498 RepID=UPI000F144771|nr:FecR domain-containing protein [Ketobacter sp.]RLT94471.1 MAG: hypothetical protein D9N14_16605 [Ketobacter sp.]